MGIAEGYSTVGDSQSSGPGLRLRGWTDSLRNAVNDYLGTWNEVSNRGSASGAAGTARGAVRSVGRFWGECRDEHIPTFAKGLAAGGVRQTIVLMLSVMCVFTVVHWSLSSAGALRASLVPAPSLCASQNDMYDTASRLCQVGHKYAFWYLKHKSWVQCAPNVPGYRMLAGAGPDGGGNYWYAPKLAGEVRAFYDTCIPECATDDDTFHVNRDLCMATDDVLVTYLNGDGQKCPAGTPGEKEIRGATSGLSNRQGRYWYKPDAAAKVRRLLEGCHATCAKNDPGLHDKVHCQVMNTLALKFLSGQGGACDKRLPGFKLLGAMGTTKDVQGAFMYPRSGGSEVQQFYLSCMRGWRPSQHAFGTVQHAAERVGGKTLRQAADEAQRRRDWRQWDMAMEMDQY